MSRNDEANNAEQHFVPQLKRQRAVMPDDEGRLIDAKLFRLNGTVSVVDPDPVVRGFAADELLAIGLSEATTETQLKP